MYKYVCQCFDRPVFELCCSTKTRPQQHGLLPTLWVTTEDSCWHMFFLCWYVRMAAGRPAHLLLMMVWRHIEIPVVIVEPFLFLCWYVGAGGGVGCLTAAGRSVICFILPIWCIEVLLLVSAHSFLIIQCILYVYGSHLGLKPSIWLWRLWGLVTASKALWGLWGLVSIESDFVLE